MNQIQRLDALIEIISRSNYGDQGLRLKMERIADILTKQKEALEGIKAAIIDSSLSDGAARIAAYHYLGGLMDPTTEDIEWARGALKTGR